MRLTSISLSRKKSVGCARNKIQEGTCKLGLDSRTNISKHAGSSTDGAGPYHYCRPPEVLTTDDGAAAKRR